MRPDAPRPQARVSFGERLAALLTLVAAPALLLLCLTRVGHLQEWLRQLWPGARRRQEPAMPMNHVRIYQINDRAELEELIAHAATLIQRVLGVQKGILLRAIGEEGALLRLRAIPILGQAAAIPETIVLPFTFVEYFDQTHAPLLPHQLATHPALLTLTPHDREIMRLLDMAIYLPLESGGECIGILGLGAKASGEAYSREDVELIYTLLEQAAMMVENLRVTQNLSIVRELQRLNEAKSSFLMVASHELKTPLTLIQGYTDILTSLPPEDVQDPQKVQDVIRGISKGAERLAQVIEDMLEISRIEAHALNLQWQEVNLMRIIEQVMAHVGPAATERGQQVEINGAEAIPLFAADPQRIFQVLHNLMENAIKFTPDGGKITITAQVLGGEAPEEQILEIVVADSGIGIAPEDQERIFEKFTRLGDATLHSSSRVRFKGGGPGLGLAIAKGVVEAHGGRIWVESPGYDEKAYPGSSFFVWLPIRRRAGELAPS